MNQTIIRPLAPGDEEYLRDESKRTGHADAIAFPETEDQIRDAGSLIRLLKGSSDRYETGSV